MAEVKALPLEERLRILPWMTKTSDAITKDSVADATVTAGKIAKFLFVSLALWLASLALVGWLAYGSGHRHADMQCVSDGLKDIARDMNRVAP